MTYPLLCKRCRREIDTDEMELCWHCADPICYECWDEYGDCGKCGADEWQDAAAEMGGGA